MISKTTSLLKGNGDRAQLLRGGSGALLLKVLNIALTLGLTIVLTRTLGTELFGIYTYIFAIIALLAVPAQFGMTTLIVRETVKAESQEDWGLLKGVWHWANISTIIISTMLVALSLLYANFFTNSKALTNDNAFLYATLAIPFIALSALRSSSLQGLRKVVQSQLPESIVRPLLLISFFGIYWFFFSKVFSSEVAVVLNVASILLSFIFGAWLLHRNAPMELLSKPNPKYKTKEWVKSIIPFSLMEGVSVINTQTDIVMLGIFGSVIDVGFYRVASQGALITTVGLTAVAMASMPFFARFYAQGDLFKLSKVAVITARISMLLAIPLSLLFIFYGDIVLSIFFGKEFSEGYLILIILTVVQLINAMFGTSGRILNMTGYEKDTLNGMLVATLCNIVLNFVLIPLHGAQGAAWATGTSILLRNIMLWFMVHRRLGIDTSMFGIFHNKTKIQTLQKTKF